MIPEQSLYDIFNQFYFIRFPLLVSCLFLAKTVNNSNSMEGSMPNPFSQSSFFFSAAVVNIFNWNQYKQKTCQIDPLQLRQSQSNGN